MLKSRSKAKKLHVQKPWDVVDDFWGGWNYPEPIKLLGANYHPGQNPHLKRLIYMAEHGWYYCQKATIELQIIHPWTNYKPVISDEFRETFNVRHEQKDPLTLTVYEREGKLIMSNDWETYWLYRELQVPIAYCVLVGHFSEVPGIAVLERPFIIEKPTQSPWQVGF